MATFIRADSRITSPLAGAPIYRAPIVADPLPASVSDYLSMFTVDSLAGVDGTPVETWEALFGSNKRSLVASSASTRPVVASSAGERFLRLDGVDDTMAAAGTGTVERTVTFVGRHRGPTPLTTEKFDVLVNTCVSGASGGLSVSQAAGVSMYGTSTRTLGTNSMPVNQWCVITAAFPKADGTGGALALNGGTPVAGNNGAAILSDKLVLAGLSGPGSNVDTPPIDVKKLILWNRTLTDEQIIALHQALMNTHLIV